MVGAFDDRPCLPDSIDVPSPRQRFEGDGDTEGRGELSDGVQLLGRQIGVVDGIGQSIGTCKEHRGPELCHHLELTSHTV